MTDALADLLAYADELTDPRRHVEVGHGIGVVVLQVPTRHFATTLTPRQAEVLGIELIRQAGHARSAKPDEDG